jgi:hypothetical protein
MSLVSWKNEFFPEEPTQERSKAADDIDLLRDALKKWKGFNRYNVEKHGLELTQYSDLRDPSNGQSFTANESTCGLCMKYVSSSHRECPGCPLNQVRGARCDERVAESEPSPYELFRDYQNPVPMISLLTACLMSEEQKQRPQPSVRVVPLVDDEGNVKYQVFVNDSLRVVSRSMDNLAAMYGFALAELDDAKVELESLREKIRAAQAALRSNKEKS